METGLDEKDFKILEALQENSKLSTQKIARRTLIPITTVHNRIIKLTKNGMIKKYTILLDERKLGTISAYILCSVDFKKLKSDSITPEIFARKLKKNDGVQSVSFVTGGVDILLRVRMKSISDLEEFVGIRLRNFEGVTNSQTMVILSEY